MFSNRFVAGFALAFAAPFALAAGAPIATTLAPTNVTATSVQLNASVHPNGRATTVSFDGGLTTGYGNVIAASPSSLSRRASTTSITATISGALTCGTTYHYRVRATNSLGTTLGADRAFTTTPCSPPPNPVAPTATTATATTVTATGATLNGSASAGSATATLSFDYGTTTAYGSNRAATPSSLAANASGSMSAALSGLACGTTYHFRARATSSAGTALGSNQSFATASCTPPPTPVAPTASTAAASAVTATGATLNGSATAGSANATLSFDYGTSTAYGSSMAATPSGLAANASGAMNASLAGLACGTTYHFRARATSSAGTGVGSNQSFATAACSPPPPTTACSSTTVHCVSATAGSNQEFATIQAAVNAAVPGDTVLVFDGNYVGFAVTRSGTAAAPITVKANGANVVVDRPSSYGEGIRVNNSSYVVIEGFKVRSIGGMGLAARGASVSAPMRGVVFRDNDVRNSGDNNIYASQVVDSLIEGNVAVGSASNNGIYIANGGSQNTTVRGNVSSNNFANGIHTNGDLSVGGDGLITGLVIEENVVYENGENGINMDGVQSTTFRNNVVYNNVRHAIRGYAIDGAAGPRDLVIVNNTLVVRSGNTPVKLTNDLGGHTIFNNVLANEGTSGGSIVVGTATGLRSDYNTFVNAGFSLNGGSTMLSLTQWRAQAGAYDGNSRTSTPAELFVAPASRDYRLRAGAVAANAGVASYNGRTAPADDIAGTARPLGGAYDHGAYESF